jgi:hypothetical protein
MVTFDALHADPATGGSSQSLAVGGSTVLTIGVEGGSPWADGVHTVRLQDGRGGAVVDSDTFTVR